MFQTSVAQLVEENGEKLGLAWVSGDGAQRITRDAPEAAAIVGHLNLIHPNRIQVVGAREAQYLGRLSVAELDSLLAQISTAAPAAVLFADGTPPFDPLVAAVRAIDCSVLATPRAAAEVIDKLRRYLGRTLAETTNRHGVFMDVLGVGVLITGDSGVGKSELGLELISRGHGLVADDVVEISKIAAGTLEGRAPPMLKDFLEVRGLGVLNMRTIFGEAAVRAKLVLRLIVHLERPSRTASLVERLPLHELSEDILEVTIPKVVIPVAAGRNLAVLLEAAVRNFVLKLRGIDSTAEFVERHRLALDQEDVNALPGGTLKAP
jgi:HPr kinase/phosphorylase